MQKKHQDRAIEIAAEGYRLLMEAILTRRGPGTADTPTPSPESRQTVRRLRLMKKQGAAA